MSSAGAAPAKAPTTAQKLLADAQASGTSGTEVTQARPAAGGPGEFAGLDGLKGLGKNGECKQQ